MILFLAVFRRRKKWTRRDIKRLLAGSPKLEKVMFFQIPWRPKFHVWANPPDQQHFLIYSLPNFRISPSRFLSFPAWMDENPLFFNNVHPTHSLFCSLLIHLFNHLSLIYMGVPKIGNIDICRFWNSFWFVLAIYDLLSALARAGNRNVKQLAAEQNSQIQLMWQRRPGHKILSVFGNYILLFVREV